jgi:predicted dehydrogenase
MKRLKCVVVGLGRIGTILEKDSLREKPCTHAGVITGNKNCILAGGCDTDEQKCRLFAEDWKISDVYTELDKMLSDVQPDIIHVSTPPETHHSIIKKAIKYNPGLIVCEKPLAHNIKDALKILNIHRQKVRILVNHERRYSVDYINVKKHIKKETYGELLSINAKVYMGQSSPASSILLHDGTHLIDIIHFLTSEKLKIRLYEKTRDYIYMFLKAGKIPVVIESGSHRDYILFELDLSFSRGRIRIGNGLYEEYKSMESPYYEKMRSAVLTSAKRPKITAYFTNMMKDAVNCAGDKTRIPVSSAEDAYYVMKLIDKVSSTV